jgi:hypothetical protein
MTTDFSKIRDILGQFYFNYRDDKELKYFIEFCDIGLPLAFLGSEGLCEINDDGNMYIAETWEMFLSALDIPDEGFDTLEQVLERANRKI